jgi:predicted transposase/invertase (TIGR01784 family)
MGKNHAILSVKQDFLFKLLFADERNTDILADFLSAVLSLPREEFESLQILDAALKKEHEDDKIGILDVNLRIKSGVGISIEIQVINKKDFEKRAVYYTGKRLIEQLGEGDPYISLNPTISINIIDFELFPYAKYHSTFWFSEETENVRLTDIERIDFLELPKARKAPGGDVKKLWMDFINAESREDLEMLTKKDRVFTRPVAEVIRLSGDAAVRAEYDARQKAIRDRMAEIAFGEERGWQRGLNEGLSKGLSKGKAEGRAEGKAEGKIETARGMKADGMSAEKIAGYTGLSVVEIEKL